MFRGVVGLGLSTLLSFFWAWADLPPELKSTLQKREEAYYNQRLLFQVEVHYNFYYKPNRPQGTQQFLLEVLRTPEIIKATLRPLDKNKEAEVVINRLDPKQESLEGALISLKRSCYITKELIAVVEPEIAVFGSNAIEKRGERAIITPKKEEHPYVSEGLVIQPCDYLGGAMGVFTVGLDASKIYRTDWERVEEKTDRWVLYGKTDERFVFPLPGGGTGDSKVEVKVELRKSDAFVKLLEVKTIVGVAIYEVLQTKRIGKWEVPSVITAKYWIPSHSAHMSNMTDASFSQITKFTLLSVEPLKNPIRLEVPEGATVIDERVNNTNYKWQGRLLSEEEVKQLALQQGRLVPEQSPHRRYSVVWFLPAVLFFAGALYLYWKQKRQ